MFGGWFGIGGSIPNFPYTLGAAQHRFEPLPGLQWQMHDATHEDHGQCTVFQLSFDESTAAAPGGSGVDSAGAAELARNAMKKGKTLMLPGLLRCLDTAEHKSSIYIATERCVPLRHALFTDKTAYYEADEARFLSGVAFGLHTVASAVKSLHCNSIAHQNISIDSVCVLPSGEWRLFGFELISNFAEQDHSIYRRYRTLVPAHRAPPESAVSATAQDPQKALPAADAFGLGVLIYEAFTNKDYNSITTTDLKQSRHLPRPLQQPFTSLTGSNAKTRMGVQKFLADDFIATNSYVLDLLELNELTLKDAVDRDSYYRKLAQNCGEYPLPACTMLLLPKLNSAVQYGGCSAAVLEPLLKIGARLEPADFAQHVSPSVLSLFQSDEHLVRYRLLATAHEYFPLLPEEFVRGKVWPLFCTGFAHRSPDIRELSVRALVHIVAKLDEKQVTTDVPKYVLQMQQDREGAIRTNATICLSLIGKYLPEATRAKTLLNGFGRMLRDPFTPSRLAAVKSLLNSVPEFEPTVAAEQILPAITPLMVDPTKDVRMTAIECVKALARKVEGHARKMPEDPEPPASSSCVGATPAAPGAGASSSSKETTSAAATPSKGWFGWGGAKKEEAPAASAPMTERDMQPTPMEDKPPQINTPPPPSNVGPPSASMSHASGAGGGADSAMARLKAKKAAAAAVANAVAATGGSSSAGVASGSHSPFGGVAHADPAPQHSSHGGLGGGVAKPQRLLERQDSDLRREEPSAGSSSGAATPMPPKSQSGGFLDALGPDSAAPTPIRGGGASPAPAGTGMKLRKKGFGGAAKTE